MGQALKDQHKICGVEMARPRKVVEDIQAPEQAVQVVATTNQDWQDVIFKMNEYAERVWSGQSVDLPKHERLRRVTEALKGQGYVDVDLQHIKVGDV